MKFGRSSFLLATLASSSSFKALAAPTNRNQQQHAVARELPDTSALTSAIGPPVDAAGPPVDAITGVVPRDIPLPTVLGTAAISAASAVVSPVDGALGFSNQHRTYRSPYPHFFEKFE